MHDGKGWILFVLSAGHFLALGTRLIYPALLPFITVAFDLSLTAAGMVLSLIWVAFAIAQLPGGFLADRIGERNTLAISILVTGLGVAIVAVAPVFGVFLLGLVVFGFASGVYGTPRLTVLNDIYPERAGTAIGLQSAAGNVGTATMPVIATLIAGLLVWQAGIGFVVPAFVAVALGIWFVVPRRTSPALSPTDRSTADTARVILKSVLRKPVLVCTLMMIGMMFIYQAFTGFLPTYLVEVKGFRQGTAATMLGIFFASAIILQPLSGGIADRFGETRIMGALGGVTLLTIGVFPLLESVWAFALLAAVAGGQLGFWPAAFSYIADILPGEVQGSGFGLLRGVFILLGALGPVLVGVLADAGYFNHAFWALAGIAGFVLVLSVLLPPVAALSAPAETQG